MSEKKPRRKRGWPDWSTPRFSLADFLFFEVISEVVGDLIEGLIVIIAEVIGGVW